MKVLAMMLFILLLSTVPFVRAQETVVLAPITEADLFQMINTTEGGSDRFTEYYKTHDLSNFATLLLRLTSRFSSEDSVANENFSRAIVLLPSTYQIKDGDTVFQIMRSGSADINLLACRLLVKGEYAIKNLEQFLYVLQQLEQTKIEDYRRIGSLNELLDLTNAQADSRILDFVLKVFSEKLEQGKLNEIPQSFYKILGSAHVQADRAITIFVMLLKNAAEGDGLSWALVSAISSFANDLTNISDEGINRLVDAFAGLEVYMHTPLYMLLAKLAQRSEKARDLILDFFKNPNGRRGFGRNILANIFAGKAEVESSKGLPSFFDATGFSNGKLDEFFKKLFAQESKVDGFGNNEFDTDLKLIIESIQQRENKSKKNELSLDQEKLKLNDQEVAVIKEMKTDIESKVLSEPTSCGSEFERMLEVFEKMLMDKEQEIKGMRNRLAEKKNGQSYLAELLEFVQIDIEILSHKYSLLEHSKVWELYSDNSEPLKYLDELNQNSTEGSFDFKNYLSRFQEILAKKIAKITELKTMLHENNHILDQAVINEHIRRAVIPIDGGLFEFWRGSGVRANLRLQ